MSARDDVWPVSVTFGKRDSPAVFCIKGTGTNRRGAASRCSIFQIPRKFSPMWFAGRPFVAGPFPSTFQQPHRLLAARLSLFDPGRLRCRNWAGNCRSEDVAAALRNVPDLIGCDEAKIGRARRQCHWLQVARCLAGQSASASNRTSALDQRQQSMHGGRVTFCGQTKDARDVAHGRPRPSTGSCADQYMRCSVASHQGNPTNSDTTLRACLAPICLGIATASAKSLVTIRGGPDRRRRACGVRWLGHRFDFQIGRTARFVQHRVAVECD